MLDYARRLTRELGSASRKDLEPLRAAGLDDEAIMHLTAVVGYFNFMNRVAIGLGVRLDENLRAAAEPEELEEENERLKR
ncbi:MAG: peroxidase [bacterium]|nr:peroxidase [bacterium]